MTLQFDTREWPKSLTYEFDPRVSPTRLTHKFDPREWFARPTCHMRFSTFNGKTNRNIVNLYSNTVLLFLLILTTKCSSPFCDTVNNKNSWWEVSAAFKIFPKQFVQVSVDLFEHYFSKHIYSISWNL